MRVRVRVRGWCGVYQEGSRECLPAPVCCQEYTAAGAGAASLGPEQPRLTCAGCIIWQDLLHSGPKGHTGIDLRDRMTYGERGTAAGSRVKWNGLEGGAWPCLCGTKHYMVLGWCPQSPFHSELDQPSEGQRERLLSRVPELLPPLTRVASSMTCICSSMNCQGLAVSHLPFSDITFVFWGPGCGLGCYLYTAPLETAPVLPRHPQSLAAAIRIPEDGLACAQGTVHISLCTPC